jgi:hypothetical protein
LVTISLGLDGRPFQLSGRASKVFGQYRRPGSAWRVGKVWFAPQQAQATRTFAHPTESALTALAQEIDPVLDRHEANVGVMSRREPRNFPASILVHFSKSVRSAVENSARASAVVTQPLIPA